MSSPSQPPSEPTNQPPTHYSSYTKQFLPYGNTPISISIFSTFPLFVPSLANFYLTVFCIFEGVFLPLTLSLAHSLVTRVCGSTFVEGVVVVCVSVTENPGRLIGILNGNQNRGRRTTKIYDDYNNRLGSGGCYLKPETPLLAHNRHTYTQNNVHNFVHTYRQLR